MVWRRLGGRAELPWVRDAVCGLLSDCEPGFVVSVLTLLDELCLDAFDRGHEPVIVCLLRTTDPQYLRIDISGSRVATSSGPGFLWGCDHGPACWEVTQQCRGTRVWAYHAPATPGEAARSRPAADPSLN
jgi:hypothetical protein